MLSPVQNEEAEAVMEEKETSPTDTVISLEKVEKHPKLLAITLYLPAALTLYKESEKPLINTSSLYHWIPT